MAAQDRKRDKHLDEHGARQAARERLDLNGIWRCRLLPGEVSVGDDVPTSFDREISVPGAWQAQGIGEPSGVVRNDFTGAVCYGTKVEIPASWRGKIVRLRIGGAYRFVRAFVNGKRVGDHDSISAPYAFDITHAIRAGQENSIAIWVSNVQTEPNMSPLLELPQPEEMLSGGDVPTGMINYITKWGGFYEGADLEAVTPAHVESVYVTTDLKTVRFQISAVGPAEQARVSIPGFESVTAPVSNGKADIEVPVPGARLWTPDDPYLYTAGIALLQNGEPVDTVEERIGIRTLTTQGRTLLLNGKPLYLRGYGDDNVEVMTGFPCVSYETIKQRLLTAKSFGFNMVRFHSMTPPKTYFDVADEVGLLVMAELPAAYLQYFFRNRDFLRRELGSILQAYRNRPSLLSLALGNEFFFSWMNLQAQSQEIEDSVKSFYDEAKSIAPNTLIMSNDGEVLYPSDMICGQPETIEGDVPYIRHEFGDYHCSLPDISQIDKFTGVIAPTWLKPRRDWVKSQGLEDSYPAYVSNSQRLQQIARRHHIEKVRKNKDTIGYSYWIIMDFPAGTREGDSWEHGWFDYWWNPKNITADESREFNNAVVTLIDAGLGDRCLWSDTPKTVALSISNYGDEDLDGAQLTWELSTDVGVIAQGTLPVHAPMGTLAVIGEITLDGVPQDRAQRLELRAQITVAGQQFINRWPFWSFPRKPLLATSPIPAASPLTELRAGYPFIANADAPPTSNGLWITDRWDDAAMSYVKAGGAVWLLSGPAQSEDKATLLPAFGGKQGTVIRDHPALAGFPHAGFCDLQFFNLIENARYLNLDTWPRGIDPAIGGIRAKTNFLSFSKDLSRFGYLFEAKVGKGKLLVSALNLLKPLAEQRPEAVALVDGILRYATGTVFKPNVQIDDTYLAAPSQ